MLKPREADIPALFVVLVVLPVVAYIILGKWNEVTKKKAKINVLAQIAAEEALLVEAMASADVSPPIHSLKISAYVCAKCLAPATTRCSRCKSVRYCSGKCQIIHWRQGHKQECQQWQNSIPNFSSGLSKFSNPSNWRSLNDSSRISTGSDTEEVRGSNNLSDMSVETSNMKPFTTHDSHTARKLPDPNKRFPSKLKREAFRSDDASIIADAAHTIADTPLCNSEYGKFAAINEAYKYDEMDSPNSADSSSTGSSACSRKSTAEKKNIHNKPSNHTNLPENAVDEFPKSTEKINSKAKHTYPSVFSENATDGNETRKKLSSNKAKTSSSESSGLSSSSEDTSVKGNLMYRIPPYTLDPHKSVARAPKHYCSQVAEKRGYNDTESRSPSHVPASAHEQSSRVKSNSGDMSEATSSKSSKIPKRSLVGLINDYKKIKVLFPYEDLVKFCQCEVPGISPRGLLNCGNSCYANVVLQCLTFTKPLMVYLLRRLHSKTCRVREWCIMCELEHHVEMLLEGGGPLSPCKFLLDMSVGCQMGGGNQEDAHEFLRLVVMSMQAVCLTDLGGENKVDLGLQETTLIQQMFGGRLKSKVKCLRCQQESERYENIMDLTLEIHGWVESLEDALTQFTAPEDLDGENMYRCGRCSAYVRARKQLSLHEVPNILTIVLKRFQTGRYGKINKCVTFPDLLDMIPFVTAGADSPPLYMLYAVVVHLDTLNASFSGHYVSYVKDLQGTWFRIDDSEVQVVPLSQVMSEGAYMLFYSRSFPRPPRAYIEGALLQAPTIKHNSTKPLKSSKSKQDKEVCNAPHVANSVNIENARGFLPNDENHADSIRTDFSDATSSSDWSLFTSSDESSFTTESTRDSFSTIDHVDSTGLDPISSIFGPFYMPESSHSNSILCRKSLPVRPETRFHGERRAFISDSSASTRLLGGVHKGRNL
ncbi:Ubiquitin carboxyl-terminal hydrolase 15 [Apostasia shenzhenica]|uniref:ubiquitinyl hydrolase 1 n=1 Tax=Apostasia shenzhenica TaxID=1088818 RepID=A0A2I0B9I5_9ASPA|nr:Ubiquitin carboxyl-terminal hydrolase 15 [Apostasia shenzhenica]